jgi:hypothetical protein
MRLQSLDILEYQEFYMDYKAPKDKFRVIGEDAFEMPPREYFVGDFPTLKAAEKIAKREGGTMNPATVYDDKGNEVFRSGSTH